MKNALLMAASAAILACASAPASAANTALTLWNAANPGGAETATGTDSADLNSSSFNGVNVTFSFVDRTTGPNSLTEGNVFITNTTNTVQVLRIIAGANGYFGPDNLFNASGTILTAIGGAELAGSFFADNTNFLNGSGPLTVTGTDIADFDSGPLSGPFSFSSNGTAAFAVGATFGMAESLTLTLQPFAFVAVQSISMDAANAVPEPRTWAMFGIGFGLMALMGLKRGRKNRLATL
jgi:hypothetical protein